MLVCVLKSSPFVNLWQFQHSRSTLTLNIVTYFGFIFVPGYERLYFLSSNLNVQTSEYSLLMISFLPKDAFGTFVKIRGLKLDGVISGL